VNFWKPKVYKEENPNKKIELNSEDIQILKDVDEALNQVNNSKGGVT